MEHGPDEQLARLKRLADELPDEHQLSDHKAGAR
jgi:hypothetical protein